MAKDSITFLCSECGWSGAKWYGRCPECGEWGTISEFHESRGRTHGSKKGGRGGVGASSSGSMASSGRRNRDTAVRAVPVTDDVEIHEDKRIATGFAEFDRILGGGIVPGSVILIAGEPGIGKSTLLLESAGRIAAASPANVLYISGEESQAQIRMRAQRIGVMHENLLLASTTDLDTALDLIENENPQLAIVDSAQTITSDDIDGISGGSTQVRQVATGVIDVAKSHNIPVMLVGHVTKDGSIAGPRTLEHLVDVVCQFEGDAQTALRLLRATKNRFGPTDEVGCFDMNDEGMEEVTDPTGLFISGSDVPAEGTCVTFTMEGHRSLPIEVQALVTSSVLPAPRRATNGVDNNRVAMLVAVLYKHARLQLLANDLYISTIAGGKAREPSCDLAIAIALGSAAKGVAIPRTTAAFGEVSLTGEIRSIPRAEQRIREAARMGFDTIIVPASQHLRNVDTLPGVHLVRVTTLRQALQTMDIVR
ncbi:MAG: DNA repair protein RadA [Bifidobacteriaceae bacterium]|jgi:DNA repair protein RadA/Sms|nr:DNA repair protein RadA [Bifidobacteriaceae bacterium]MCI1979109.1 DNA repair protein RadA [Bifidobacteriaceae bacterium]